MTVIIEFCANNACFGTHEIVKKIQQAYECEVYEYGCLTNCGVCYMVPYVLVNGEHVEAENSDLLYERIVQKIEELAR